jgi:hypothetical protein
MRRILLATAFLAASSAAAAAGNAVAIPLDEVRVITFTKPVSTLYVGNPVIADVTVIDNRHAFLQGKAFGSTNLIALDADGRQIANRQVVVAGGGASVVTLQRGTSQTTYTCATSRCETSPQPGDGKDNFEAVLDQVAKHQSMLANAAAGSSQ